MKLLLATVFVVYYFVCLCASVDSECPQIISRKEWGARDSVKPLVDINRKVNFAVIHHSDTRRCFTRENCSVVVRSLQNFHLDTERWDDIGYSFVVGEDGNIYEGRGWNKVGAHSPAFNRDSIGICIVGTYMTEMPNELALNAAKSLLECSVEKGYLEPNYTLKGHRDQSQFGGNKTDCPGTLLYQELSRWPHFG